MNNEMSNNDKNVVTQDFTQDKETLGQIFVQFIKFGLVGVSNTIVSTVIFVLINQVLFKGAWLLASVMAWLISVLWAFAIQNVFVFKENENKRHRVWWQTLIKTYMTYAFTGLFLNNVLLWFWGVIDLASLCGPIIEFFASINVGFLGDASTFSSNMGWFLNMVVAIPINFLINKFWAYAQKKK